VTGPAVESLFALHQHVEAARAARAQLRRRPLRATVAALAAAAQRWQADAALRAALPGATGLSAPMIDIALPIVASALSEDAMTALVEREHGTGAAARSAPDGPTVVAHVLASNVPALALPALALGCLAGAAVLVKSGRHDALSAPAFVRALGEVDPELAATVVAAYWPGGYRAYDQILLPLADVVVATGGETALAALHAVTSGHLVAHGPRASLVAVGRGSLDDEAVAGAIAFDVSLYDQRGCLSPHAVYVETNDARAVHTFAARLARALAALAERLPPGAVRLEERAARRALIEAAEWTADTTVHGGPGGTVIAASRARFAPTCGLRTVRVHPLRALDDLPAHLPAGTVECVGVAGPVSDGLVAALRAAGVARVCRPGDMQRPPLSWPRGQQAPLGALLGRPGEPLLQVET
jgi:hypothetical protein